MPDPAELTYGSYLHLDELLDAQVPMTDEHDELLFVVIHQVYELWFKQILHELAHLQAQLEVDNATGALHTARRVGKILKTIVGQLDVLETMTPRQFAAFRPNLGSSSGFQSAQFRELEAVLGRRDFAPGVLDDRLRAAAGRPSMFDSLARYLHRAGHPVPSSVLDRDVSRPALPDAAMQAVLADVYAREDAVPVELCESFVDIDEGVQEWRYRHVKMVERVIGAKVGTGGSAGAAYLRSTLFRSAFPDLWEMRGS